ncbi:hypothetical protein FRC12_006561 [Ceratobasidium sp. 428]|nr:hypothetical protein FRC12_006561 [Ceratobasidium sp. 428]
MDNVPRSTAGARTTSNVSPVRLPASNAAHSRTSSTAASPGQPTLSNPIPLPAPRSTAQSPSTPIQTPNQTHNHLPSQNHNQPQTQNAPPAERVLDTVRGLPGDVRSPVNGVLVSPSGRTRDASLVHGPTSTHSRTGSTSQGDGFVHEGPASYRARMGEGDGTGSTNEAPHRNGVLPTISNRPPGRGSLNLAPAPHPPPGQGDEPTANNANDVQRPDSAPNNEPRADPISGSGAARAPNGTSRPIEARPGSSVVAEARTSAPLSNGSSRPSPSVATIPLPTTAVGQASSSTAGPPPPTRTGTEPDPRPTSGTTDPRPPPEDVRSSSNKPEETRPQSEEQRPPRVDEPRSRPINPLPLPDSLPRRPSVPSPITQHPARDLSIIAPMAAMGRQEISRRDSGDRNGRYDPRRDTGVRDDRRDNDRRDSGSNDRRGSTSGRDPVNNWQPAPRSNTQPRPVPPLDTRGSNLATRRDRSPHTPRNHAVPLPALESRGGPTRERSPRSRSPRMIDRDDPNTMTPVRRAKRRSQSPRGIDKLYIRAEFGSIRSSPMDMDSS